MMGRGRIYTIVWSPDGQALMLTAQFGGCSYNPDDVQARSIIRIDLPTLSMQILVNRDEREFRTKEWTEPGRVLLTGDFGDDTQWWMDAVTGEITQ